MLSVFVNFCMGTGFAVSASGLVSGAVGLSVSGSMSGSASDSRFRFLHPSDALPIPFRVRASVSEQGQWAGWRRYGVGGVLVNHKMHHSVSTVYQPAKKWQTLQGKTESSAEVKSTPEPRMEARTEPKKQVHKRNGSENGRPWKSGRQNGNRNGR